MAVLLATSICAAVPLFGSTQAPGVGQQSRLLTELQKRQAENGTTLKGGPAAAPSAVINRTVITKDLEVLRAYAKQKKPGKAEGFKGLLPFEVKKAQATLTRLRQSDTLLTGEEKTEIDTYQRQLDGESSPESSGAASTQTRPPLAFLPAPRPLPQTPRPIQPALATTPSAVAPSARPLPPTPRPPVSRELPVISTQVAPSPTPPQATPSPAAPVQTPTKDSLGSVDDALKILRSAARSGMTRLGAGELAAAAKALVIAHGGDRSLTSAEKGELNRYNTMLQARAKVLASLPAPSPTAPSTQTPTSVFASPSQQRALREARSHMAADSAILRKYATQQKPGSPQGIAGLNKDEVKDVSAALLRLYAKNQFLTKDEMRELELYTQEVDKRAHALGMK
ncbi:MAG: hypothetical protein C0514_05795 [Candidatus Puniceispirillum sp.]|nr:hypothetical protein [Candidatus Puniceispirillum sp.]